jgi:hypothetical protein
MMNSFVQAKILSFSEKLLIETKQLSIAVMNRFIAIIGL